MDVDASVFCVIMDVCLDALTSLFLIYAYGTNKVKMNR